MIDRAVHDGYEGLCATGDMRWELGDDQNLDRLLEYEARLEQVFDIMGKEPRGITSSAMMAIWKGPPRKRD